MAFRAALLLCAACLAALPAEAATMYRYRNEAGVVVVDFRLPPEYADQGYEILNEAGIVVEVVPRALTDDERADASSEERQRRDALAEQERLREWDESLLLRYSTVEDIEAARDRSLRDLRIRVSILKSNRRSLRQRVENTQARVAEAERLGRAPQAADLDTIASLKAEIDATERQLDEREVQIEGVVAEYQRDIDRFRLLQDVVELRRSLERPNR